MNATGVGGADRFDSFSQRDRRAPVGSFPANPWGLFDTHGNVWEWTLDSWYRRYTAEPVQDPVAPGPGTHRIYRGGGYERYAWTCRSAVRRSGAPSRMAEDLGFRVVVE
jgi:formylglycine-generating enzyme required for sulfatase activity